MNVTIERKKSDCSALPKGWQREEVLRKTGLSAGKVDVYYYRLIFLINYNRFIITLFCEASRFIKQTSFGIFIPLHSFHCIFFVFLIVIKKIFEKEETKLKSSAFHSN